MKIQKNIIYFSLITVSLFLTLTLIRTSDSYVLREAEKTYIVDRTTEKWDVTQAESIGFKPGNFRFGLGRHAFTPLDESDWQSKPFRASSNLRVIGVSDGKDAHAYSVRKLSRHETANTMLGNQAIVAAY